MACVLNPRAEGAARTDRVSASRGAHFCENKSREKGLAACRMGWRVAAPHRLQVDWLVKGAALCRKNVCSAYMGNHMLCRNNERKRNGKLLERCVSMGPCINEP